MTNAPTPILAKKRALIIVDVQNDFCPGGSLAVPNGDDVIPVFNKLRETRDWDLIVLTQDFHPEDHVSFASNHEGKNPFEQITLKDGTPQVMWPNHCVQGTKGTLFHPELHRSENDVIVQKGKNRVVDSYSGFFDNNKKEKTELEEVLKKHNITEVYVGGLATDYCVQFTAVDAAELGFDTFFIEDASKGIAQESIDAAMKRMRENGVNIVQSKDIPVRE